MKYYVVSGNIPFRKTVYAATPEDAQDSFGELDIADLDLDFTEANITSVEIDYPEE